MQYELVDSGAGEKLERFGDLLLIRPCAGALWQPRLPAAWEGASARFTRERGNQWQGKRPKDWQIEIEGVTFSLLSTDFGHLGIFPEHATVWRFIREKIEEAKRPIKFLNLFAYTGGATLVAAKAGAEVCHLDASHGMVEHARGNACLSGLGSAPIRWIVDDAVKFVQRELRRGNRYDAILLDPPSFGRGAKGEIFKIENEGLLLLEECVKLLSDDPLFLLFSCHTPGFTPQVMRNVLSSVTEGKIEAHELIIPSAKSYDLPLGSYAHVTY